MNTTRESAAGENPFSTRHVRPGAVPYVFPSGESERAILARLAQNGWRGQIVGPHGSGKSALLATLVSALETQGKPVVMITLHDRQRRLPEAYRSFDGLEPGTLIIVDGYEQLAFWNRVRLRQSCGRRGLGLLVTAHRPVGLPDLFHTATSPWLAERLVDHLLGGRASPVDREQLHQRFERHQGNLRELLFDLYDAFEQHR